MFKRVTLTACLLSLTYGAYQGPIAGGQPAALYPAGLDPKSCPNFPVCTNHAVSTVKGFEQHQSSTTYEASQIYQPQRPAYQLRYTSTPLVQLQKYSHPEYKYVPSSARPHQYSSPQPAAPSTQQHNAGKQYAPPQQYTTTSQQYTGPQQFTPSQQYTAPQNNAPPQQYVPPEKYATPQQYAPPQKYAPPKQNVQSSSDDQYTPEQKRALDRGEYIGDGDYHGEGLAEALAPEYHPGQQQSYHRHRAAAAPSVQHDTPAYQKVSAFLAQSQNIRQTPTKDCRNHAYC